MPFLNCKHSGENGGKAYDSTIAKYSTKSSLIFRMSYTERIAYEIALLADVLDNCTKHVCMFGYLT